MNGNLIELDYIDLVISSGLIIVAGLISILLGLKIGKRLLLVSIRTVLQLGLVGLILKQVFAMAHPLPVAGLLFIMTIFAAREAVARTKRRYKGIYLDGWLAMTLSCLVVGGVVTQGVVGVQPWFSPRYVIPLLGMILGNSLTGVALGLDRFLQSLDANREQIELLVVFGASRSEALRDLRAEAVRTGLIPIMNSMAAAGIVSLPGMMTGQILAGSPPLQAVAYQIVVMFMIAAADAVGAMIAVMKASTRVMDSQAKLV
ncbi:MAG: iron export ABC transporter permease subunit FetB [Deltaproteobacteria bacterium]|nr:iron export ABC transporter permease subunit FetB [Deltaproteobacteria bacterium]